MRRSLGKFCAAMVLASIGLVWGCASTPPPPCAVTTTLLPEERQLQVVRYDFDDSGVILAEHHLAGLDEQPIETTRNIYNDDGMLVGRVVESHDDEGGMAASEAQYTLDDEGRLVEVAWFDDPDDREDPNRREVYVYDEAGNLAEERYFEEANILTRHVRHIYDDSGRLVRTDTDEDADLEVDHSIVHTYAESGEPLTVEVYRAGEVLDKTTTFNYDDDGRLISVEEDYGGDGIVEQTDFYRYSEEDGTLTFLERDEDNDGVIDRTTEQIYDDEGRLVQEVELTADHVATDAPPSMRTAYDFGCWDEEE